MTAPTSAGHAHRGSSYTTLLDSTDRYVSRASVHAYLAAHPVPTDQAYDPDDALLTCTQAARVAGITRPQLTTLTATYQVRTCTKPGSRHVYINATSLIDWANRTQQPSVADAIAAINEGLLE